MDNRAALTITTTTIRAALAVDRAPMIDHRLVADHHLAVDRPLAVEPPVRGDHKPPLLIELMAQA